MMPPVTRALLIANVAVFLLQSASGGLIEYWFALWPLGPRFQIWQVLTYGFLHGGLAHIFFNMFALYMFGSDVERLFGPRYFLTYYLVCVVSAAIFQLLVTGWIGAPGVPTIGASGAVYGLLLAFGMYFPRRMVMLIFPPIPMQARTFVILFGALELVFGVTGTADGVAHFAHLGGMAGGWLVIQYRRRGFPFQNRR